MCIVIDTNVLNQVFNKNNADHHDFEPVYEWIYNSNGVIVYGGTKYLAEITKYANIFNEFRNIGKAKRIPTSEVDGKETEVTATIVHKDFDDQHLVALLIVSGCKLICSLDERAYPFFQHRTFFTSKQEPKIYKKRTNSRLLNTKYIVLCCQPTPKHNKNQRKKFPKLKEKK